MLAKIKEEREMKKIGKLINKKKLKINLKIKGNLKDINKFIEINSKSNLPYLSKTSKNDNNSLKKIKHKIKNSLTNNYNNNSIEPKKNFYEINAYSPKNFPKFSKNNLLAPINSNINYFKTIRVKNINYLTKKNNSLQNIYIQNNNASKTLKNNTSYNNSTNKSKFYSNHDNKILKKNFSNYFYKSQSSLYTSKRIFHHYINESKNEKINPESFFERNGAPKSRKKINELYKLNLNYHKRLEEVKRNKSIAYKDDFNILKYQTTLIKLISKKISIENLRELQTRYIQFNEKVSGKGVAPKGRFTNLAEKIKHNIPVFLYEKIKKLDKEKLISRYNYYKKANEDIHNRFEKMYSKKYKRLKIKLEKMKNIDKNKTIDYNLNYSF